MKLKGTMIVILVITTIIISSCGANKQIPDDASVDNKHRYAVYEDCETWEEARDRCKELGGHLAVIESEEENAYLYSYIQDRGFESAYFGFYLDTNVDDKEDETWRWVMNNKSDYTNWYKTEPNRENPNEIYGMFYWKFTDGTWNDGDFGNETNGGGRAYICEWE